MTAKDVNLRRQSTATLGEYQLLAELGRGGMAEVYLAVAAGMAGFNKLVVIKRIRPSLADEPDFLRMFLDEARLAAKLNHPNIVQTFGVYHEEGEYFMAMEYLEGQPLNRVLHRLKRRKGFPLGLHLKVIREILRGLHYAHELTDYDGTPLEIVHRDASPHNIFLTYSGQVKLVDFGIAKTANSTAETCAGVLKGKVVYMSPEQARCERVDRRADVFSLGVLIWEALASRRIWHGTNDLAVLKNIIVDDPKPIPPPSEYSSEVPEAAERVCMKALAMNRDDRYANAAELRRDLDKAIKELPKSGSIRAAGELVSQAFADQRQKIRAVIERKLRQLQEAAGSTAFSLGPLGVPSIPPLDSDYPPVRTGPPTTSDSSAASLKALGGDSASLGTPLTAGTASTAGASPGADTGRGPASSAPPGHSEQAPAPRRSRLFLFVVAVGLLLAGATVGTLVPFSGAAPEWPLGTRPLPPPAAPQQPATTASHTTTTVSQSEIEIWLRVLPKEATIYIDGQPVAGNPYTGSLPADGREHDIRAEASGYKTQFRTVTFDKHHSIEVVLEKEKKWQPETANSSYRVPNTGATIKPATRTRSTDDGPRPSTGKPMRPIDDSNPYAP